MFGRKKDVEPEPEPIPEPETEQPAGNQKKGRPTPTRKEQEAARRRPLVPDDRKAARNAERQAARQAQMEARVAMETGDEAKMPFRDRGPQKRFARDFVDSRSSVGEWLMIVVIVYLVFAFMQNVDLQMYVTIGLWVLMVWVVIEAFLHSRAFKKAALARFGELEQGLTWYAVTRQLQLRRLRMPKPQVRRGEAPRPS